MNRFIAVSIIMPVYQVELYVERAIESVLAQTLQEKELILSHLDKYNKITRNDVIELCRCAPNHASWLLRQLLDEGSIQMFGAGRGAFYKKAVRS